MRPPQARPRDVRERSRNVSWSQWLHELRSHRALAPGRLGVAHTWRYLPCVRPEADQSRLAHIAKSAMYAPPARRARPSGTKPECVLESMASQSTLPSRIGPGEIWGGAHVAVFAMCASGGRFIAARTHRKKRDVCATRSARATFGNEAGMCPGINGFTNYAPIAHWSRGDLGWRIHGGVCHVCVLEAGRSRIPHTSQRARCMRHPRLQPAARHRVRAERRC